VRLTSEAMHGSTILERGWEGGSGTSTSPGRPATRRVAVGWPLPPKTPDRMVSRGFLRLSASGVSDLPRVAMSVDRGGPSMCAMAQAGGKARPLRGCEELGSPDRHLRKCAGWWVMCVANTISPATGSMSLWLRIAQTFPGQTRCGGTELRLGRDDPPAAMR